MARREYHKSSCLDAKERQTDKGAARSVRTEATHSEVDDVTARPSE